MQLEIIIKMDEMCFKDKKEKIQFQFYCRNYSWNYIYMRWNLLFLLKNQNISHSHNYLHNRPKKIIIKKQ